MLKTLVSRGVLLGAAFLAAPAMAGNIEAGRAASNACAACHGIDGNSANPAFPSLAGQSEKYLVKQLEDYRSGNRANPIMAPQAQGLSDDDIRNLAAYYASQTLQHRPSGEKNRSGEIIYRYGLVESGIAACAACHGPTGNGNDPAGYPRLRGLSASYVAQSLRDYRDGSRANDPNEIMRELAGNMSDEQIEAVAAHIASLH